jgi:large subunit ribosomal protein L47
MARIKYVINERRLAYEGALKIHGENVEQAAKGEGERENSPDVAHQEREGEAKKASSPVSEATQAAVDSLLQRSTT